MPETLNISQAPIAPDKERERIEAFRSMAKGCASPRCYYDVWWASGIAMTEGQQWIEEAITSQYSGGRRILRAYPERYDGGIDNIRVTLNRTRELANDVASLLRVSPEGWALRFDPDERNAVGSSADVLIMRRVWEDYLRQPMVDFTAAEEAQNEWRVQAGSGLIKICRDTANPYGWTPRCVSLDRMTWDAANKSPRIESHRQWADTVAWDAVEFERTFGIKFPENVKKRLPRLGTLRAFDELMGNIRSLEGARAGDSETPGILVSEFYDADETGLPWTRLTIIAHTGFGDGRERVVWDGKNPLGFCPFLKADMLVSLLGPWGVGVPHLVDREQKITNIVFTSIARHLLAVSANQWVIEKGTIQDPQTMLSPRVGGPIEWDRRDNRSQPPYINKPPDIPSALWQMAGLLPRMMSDKIHIPPALQGQGGSREPAATFAAKIAQGERPFARIADRDHEAYGRFFTQFVRFLCERSPLELLQRAVGPDLEATLVSRLTGGSVLRSHVKVTVPRSAIQPRTPAEREAALKEWAALKVLRPEELRYELASQLGMPVTAIEEAVVANIASENQAFLQGATAEEIQAVHFERHDLHINGHSGIIDKRRTMNVPPEIIDQLRLHVLDHWEERADELELAAAGSMATQGQVGATENVMGASFADELPNTPLSGSLAAPNATQTDYGMRELERTVAPEGAPA